jgi:hypothetical protein
LRGRGVNISEDARHWIGLLKYIYACKYKYWAGTIEHAIKNRINKLYKILCLRWQSDEKTWLSHIAWLKQVRNPFLNFFSLGFYDF